MFHSCCCVSACCCSGNHNNCEHHPPFRVPWPNSVTPHIWLIEALPKWNIHHNNVHFALWIFRSLACCSVLHILYIQQPYPCIINIIYRRNNCEWRKPTIQTIILAKKTTNSVVCDKIPINSLYQNLEMYRFVWVAWRAFIHLTRRTYIEAPNYLIRGIKLAWKLC